MGVVSCRVGAGRFAALINDGYSRQAAYHNHAHAANCVWAIQHWLRNTPAMYSLTPLQFYAALMAAAIHDFRHPYVARLWLLLLLAVPGWLVPLCRHLTSLPCVLPCGSGFNNKALKYARGAWLGALIRGGSVVWSPTHPQIREGSLCGTHQI